MMTVSRQYSVTTTVIHRVASLSDGGPRTAPFEFEGDQQNLEFDGKLERCVVDNISSSNRDGLFTDLKQLEPLFKDGTFEKTREKVKQDGPAKVDLGTDRKWNALEGDKDTMRYQNGVSLLELFPGDHMVRMTVKTDLAKAEQQIAGTYNPKTGTISIDLEQIQVTTGQV